MQILSLIVPFLAATMSSAQTVYLIRHGEKPADGDNGLTAQGMQRAQCLRNVFGASSQYHVGYIIVEQPKSSKITPSPLEIQTIRIHYTQCLPSLPGFRIDVSTR